MGERHRHGHKPDMEERHLRQSIRSEIPAGKHGSAAIFDHVKHSGTNGSLVSAAADGSMASRAILLKRDLDPVSNDNNPM
jgi:hypothetical protein